MDDYFHTGAGARYLRRADQDVVVKSLRGYHPVNGFRCQHHGPIGKGRQVPGRRGHQ